MGASTSYRFNIKMMVDGKEQVGELTGDLGALRQALSDVKGNMRLDAAALNLSAVMQSISQAQQAIQGLQGALQGLQQAYRQQEEAETKLEVVMRQRMGATDESIQGIKDLASEQQRLGVIGDEVQLMGAQQMATFLSEEQALRVLIPAMNNLVAQQKGVSATASDAVSVANLMGKAMQGNASALTRVGITMTDAQKSALEMGTEMERAAMLARIITDNVGQMNEELARTSSGRQQQLANALGDVKERLGELAGKALPIVSMANGMAQAAGNAARLAKGITSLTAVQKIWNATSKTGITDCKRLSKNLARIGVTASASSVGVRMLSTAIRGLFIATGVGVAIGALSFAVEHLMLASDKAKAKSDDLAGALKAQKEAAEAAAERERNAAETYASAEAKLKGYIAKIEAGNLTKTQEAKLVKELNEQYGSSMGYFDSLTKWYKALKDNSEAYCQQLVNQIRLQDMAQRIAKITADAEEIEKNAKAGKYSKKPQIQTKMVERPHSPYQQEPQYDIVQEVIPASSEYDKKRNEANELRLELHRLMQDFQELSKTNITLPNLGSPTAPTGQASGKGNDGGDKPVELLISKLNTIEEMDEALAHLAKQQRTQSLEDAKATQLQIDTIKAKKAHFLDLLSTEIKVSEADPVPELDPKKLDTIEKMEAAVAHLTKLQRTQGQEAAKATQKQIDEINALRDAFLAVEEPAEKLNISETLMSAYGATRSLAGAVRDLFDAFSGGGSVLDRVLKGLDAMIAAYQAVNTIMTIAKAVSEATATAKTQEAVASTAAAVAGVAQEAQAGANVAADAAQTAANKTLAASWLEVAAAQTFAAHAYIPFAGTGIAAAMVAAQKAAVVAVGATPFAKGGLVYGPTLALAGEYAGASSNPEVIAPLDKLRDIVGGGGLGGDVKFRIEGGDLVGVLKHQTKKTRRLGNG